MKNLKVKNLLFGLSIVMGTIIFMPSCEQPAQDILHDCDLEGPTNFDFDETVDFYANDVPGALYYWEVPECMTIIPDDNSNDRFITVSGSPDGCQGNVSVYICTSGATPPDENNCSYCFLSDVICNPTPLSCEKHIAQIDASLNWGTCWVTIEDMAPRDPDCGPYTYEWEVDGLSSGNTMPFGDGPITGFHAQHIEGVNGTNNIEVRVTVTNSAGSQIAPYRIFNLSSSCNQ